MTTAAGREPTEEDDLGPADLLAADSASMCLWAPRTGHALESAMTMELFGVPITATSVPLIDEAGVSHWMTSKRAAVCAEMRKTAMAA